LQWQHRRATGMGGSDLKPRLEDGLTSCADCNPAYENTMQALALRFGWKVRRWVLKPELVPVFYWPQRTWHALTVEGRRVRISTVDAMRMMKAVYGPKYVEGEGLAAK